MAEDKMIQLSSSYDPGTDYIKDTSPELVKRMYVYKLAIDNREKGFFVPGGTTFLRLEPNEPEFADTVEDPDNPGHFFVDAMVNEDLQAYLAGSASATYVGAELEYQQSLQVLVQGFTDHKKRDRFLITFDNPFNTAQYRVDDQEAFIIDSGSIADAAWFEFNTENIVNETSTVFNLQSLKTIEDNIAYTKIIPYVSATSPLAGLTELDMKANESFLLERVTGYTKPAENFLPLDLKAKDDQILTPVKALPTSLDNHLTSYFDWLDLDVTMPETLAKQFLVKGGVKLDTVLTSTEDFQLVSDMILFTAGYQQQFKQVARNNDGKFEPSKLIGYSRTPLSALVGQQPMEIISALVDNYLKANPSKKDGNEFKTITSIIAALSRYIISTYSIASGNNTFNEFYLPWYLDLTTGLGISESNDVLNVAPESLKFELKSKWFDLEYTGKKIKDFKGINLTEPRIKQLQNKFQMPELPIQLGSGDLGKAFNPGGIDPRNPKELNYILYNIGKAGANDESLIKNILDTEAKQITAGTQLKVSTGELSPINLPTGILPQASIRNAPSNLYYISHVLERAPYALLIGTDATIRTDTFSPEYDWDDTTKLLGTYASVVEYIDNYFKPRIAAQLGITDLSAINVSIPNYSSESGWRTVATSEQSISNRENARGNGYANMLNIAIGDIYRGGVYRLDRTKAPLATSRKWDGQPIGVSAPNENLANRIKYSFGVNENWDTITDVNNSPAGQWYSKWLVEPVSLQGKQGVVRYKQVQPKEIVVTFTKDVVVNSFTEGKVLFNKSNWNKKIKSTTNTLDASLKVEIDTEQADINEQMEDIKILEIKGLMLEHLQINNLKIPELSQLQIAAPSNTDETITVMRIAFL